MPRKVTPCVLGATGTSPRGRPPRPRTGRTSCAQKLTTTTSPACVGQVVACRCRRAARPVTRRAPAVPVGRPRSPGRRRRHVRRRARCTPTQHGQQRAQRRAAAARAARRRTHQAPLAVRRRATGRPGARPARGSRCRPASSPSKWKLVRLARPHWRRRGSCQSRLRSRCRRRVQIGSWCETQTASCPSACARAVEQRGVHPLRDGEVGLAPGRAERVAQHPPVARVAQRAVADADPLALEEVRALDQPLVDPDRQPELGRDRLGGLLRALQRARHDHA